MEYTVHYTVTTTFRGSVTVTAESEEDAKKQVRSMHLPELEEGHEETDVYTTEIDGVVQD